MNNYKSSAELKTMAKDRLDGNYSLAILMLFLISVIEFSMNGVITLTFPNTNLIYIVFSYLATLVISIFMGIFQAGIVCFFLNMACGYHCSISDMFFGFKNQTEKVIQLSAVFSLLHFICYLPFQIFSSLYFSTLEVKWVIFTMLSLAIGMVLYYVIFLAISQSFYLLLDFPDKNVHSLLQTSSKMMKGHMGRFFYLIVSFLPLMILCVFTCGIGFLWLTPYMNLTYTYFFLDLMRPNKIDVAI